MTVAPPRLRLLAPPAPPASSPRTGRLAPPDPADSPAPGDAFSLTPGHAAAPAASPAEALLALDALLAAADPPADATCSRLAALAVQVPGRSRQVAAALGRAASSAAVDALLALPPASPGVLEALHRCFARGVRRDMSPQTGPKAHVPSDTSFQTGPEAHVRSDGAPANRPSQLAPPLLALDFRSSRASRFPELVRRAQALGQAPGATFEALDLDGKRRYRLAFWPDRAAPLALAAALRASHLDLVWLHARLAKLQGTRLWLSGWSFDGQGPHSPAIQAHLLQAWLHFTEQDPPP
jgi:hypothetical protein